MKARLRALHRYVSLACVALWLLQAVTGFLLVFHWELDDALVAGPAAKLDPAAMGARIEALQASRPGDRVATLYASGGDEGRFDLMIDTASGGTDAVRMDGAGTVLRDGPHGLFQATTYLHQTLFLGDAGTWLLGISGVLLLSNIVMGLTIAWPRAGQWRRSLRPSPRLRGVGWFYGWHRALGLWLAVPALLLVTTGILLVFAEPVGAFLGAERPTPSAQAAQVTPRPGAAGQALAVALQRYPQASFASMRLPTEDAPWYRVRLRLPGEWRRVYGTTSVFVDARDGTVLLAQAARDGTTETRVFETLQPLHTGEAGGWTFRTLVAVEALWLLAMIVLGSSLWWKRRRVAQSPRVV